MLNNIFKKSIFIFYIFIFFIFVNKASAIVDLQKGLVARYPLNSASSIKDATPYMRNGVNSGATLTTGRKGETGGAYSFNGTSSYIDLPNDLGYRTQVSAFAWFKSNGTPTGGYHIIFGGSYLEISIPTVGELRTGVTTSTSRFVSNGGTGLTNGSWHHVGFTFDGTKKRAYIDGVLVGEQSVTGTLSYFFSTRRIGRFGADATYYLNGALSDARIYNRALSGDEVKSLYDTYRPAVISGVSLQKGLIAHYPLNNFYGVKDITPSMRSGTNNGAVLTAGRKGETDGAYSFNGSSNYIRTGIIPQSNYFSISTWFKTSATSGNVYWGNGSDKAIMTLASGNKLSWYVRTSVGPIGYKTSATSFIPNAWNHAVLIYDGSQVRLYINGIQDSVTGAITGYSAAGAINIGTNYNMSGAFFNGSITDMRFYNRAISAAEVKSLFDSYRPKTSVGTLNKGLILDIPLTTKYMKSSSVVSDNTPNMKNGTIYGGAVVNIDSTVFDGVDDYIDCGNITAMNSLANITVSVWAFSSNFNQNAMLVMKNPVNTVWEMYLESGIWKWRGGGTGNSMTSTLPSNNVWHLFTVTQSGTTTKMYMDGILVKTGTESAIGTSTGNVNIGRYTGAYYFNGKITGVKIYNRALSSDEIKLLYDKGR